jgi:hypothetical protein
MTQTLNIYGNTADTIADMVLGCRVDRPAEIMAAAEVLFTVYGGDILMTGFYGEIMVAIDTVNAYTLTFDADIKNTNVYVDTVLGSASAALNGYVAGRMFYLPVEGGALTVTAAGGACPIDISPPIILPPGHFDLTGTNPLTLGQVRWSMWYIPIDAGAYVLAS